MNYDYMRGTAGAAPCRPTCPWGSRSPSRLAAAHGAAPASCRCSFSRDTCDWSRLIAV